MKYTFQRLLAVLLTLAMVISLLPIVALASEKPDSEPESDLITAEDNAVVQADILDDINLFFTASAKRSKGYTLADYIEATDDIMAMVMASDTYVEGSIVERGDGFFWQTTTGITCGYFPEDRYEADRAVATKSVDTSELAQWNYAQAGKNDVCVIGPFYSEDSDFSDQYTLEALSIADALGGTAYGLIDSEANVVTIAEAIEKCGVVIFDSHGGTDWQVFDGGSDGTGEADNTSEANTSYIWLSSGAGMTTSDCAYVTGTYGTYPHAYKDTYGNYLTDGTAIANHMSAETANCLLWMAICLGMATDGMCAPLRAKGVPVVYGYSQSVTFYGDYLYEATFWDNMIDGTTVSDAIAAMKNKHGSWDPYYKNYTQSSALSNYAAFPIVVSGEDAYPGQGNVDAIQSVKSTYTLFAAEVETVPVTVTLISPDEVLEQDGTSNCAMPLPTVTAPSGYTFVGWTTAAISGETTAKPVIYSGSFIPSESLTLYALFSRCEEGNSTSDVYSLHSGAITEGDYVIVYSDGAMLAADADSSGRIDYLDVTIENDTISAPSATIIWYIAPTADGYYTIYNAENGVYAAGTGTKNKSTLLSSVTDYAKWSVSGDSTYDFVNLGNTAKNVNAILRKNGTYGFACYGTGTGGALSLYIGAHSTVYYTTSPGVCAHAETTGVVTDPTCTENGSNIVYCSSCNVVISEEVISAVGHSYTQTDYVAPGCLEDGTETMTCSVCSDSYMLTIPAIGHNYVDGVCENCNTPEPSESALCGRYYFSAIRSSDTYYQYIMGVMDGTRYDIESSGLTELPATITTTEADKIFVIEQNDDGTYRIYAEGISDDAKYLGWTSGNSGCFVTLDSALHLSIDKLDSGLYNIHFNAGDEERYLSINKTASNTYAAWYRTGQTKDLALIPIAESATEHIHNAMYCENQPADCTNDGTIAYYYCVSEDCPNYGTCYMDEELSIEILPEDLIDPATGHNYVDGTCTNCGVTEVTEPKYNENLTLSMAVSVGAEMQVTYTVYNARVKSYESFYVEVVKEVANGESVTTVYSLDANNLTALNNPVNGALLGYNAIYTGINASMMGDNFTATLYAVTADGVIEYGPSTTSSIKTYLTGLLADEATIAELKTLAVDMLNYGAAAQSFFGYDVENPVNADLTEEQKALGTQEIPAAADTSSITGTGGAIMTDVSLQSKVMLYLTFVYSAKEDSNLTVVIKDSESKLLEELVPTKAAAIAWQTIYANVGAKQMRESITIELHDNGTCVSKTLTWNIESYVAQTRAKTDASAELLNAVNAMLTYGDSAAAYMTATGR